MATFTESVTICLKKKYATFQGRASRSEYWWFYLFCVMAYMIPAVLLIMGSVAVSSASIYGEPSMSALAMTGLGGILMFVVALGLLVPSLAVTVRRLHDTGKEWWYILFGLIPYIGGLILLIFCVQSSQPETNKFGPCPVTEY